MYIRMTLLATVVTGALWGQAAAEAAAGAARATSAVPAAGKTGKSISDAFSKIGRALTDSTDSAAGGTVSAPPKAAAPQSKAAAANAVPAKAAAKPTAKPDVSYEDPSGIRTGMEPGEVLRRFGPPDLRITSGEGEQTLCYPGVDVVLSNGRVAAVKRDGASGK
jgi:hypothetical protein